MNYAQLIRAELDKKPFDLKKAENLSTELWLQKSRGVAYTSQIEFLWMLLTERIVTERAKKKGDGK